LDASINLIIYKKKKKLQGVRREFKKKLSKTCYLRRKWGFSEYLILVLVLVFNLIHLLLIFLIINKMHFKDILHLKLILNEDKIINLNNSIKHAL
jgi:hypothetical protein